MPIIDKHAPGSFCWMELATPDQQAAKAFYGSLFGWTAQDRHVSRSDVYTMFRLQDRDAAAARALFRDERESGVPPFFGDQFASLERASNPPGYRIAAMDRAGTSVLTSIFYE
jgi:predicted enzyme related to lactoylglutathione lyase